MSGLARLSRIGDRVRRDSWARVERRPQTMWTRMRNRTTPTDVAPRAAGLKGWKECRECVLMFTSHCWTSASHEVVQQLVGVRAGSNGQKGGKCKGAEQCLPVLSAMIKVARFRVVQQGWEVTGPEDDSTTNSTTTARTKTHQQCTTPSPGTFANCKGDDG